jgi:hypothetical protein
MSDKLKEIWDQAEANPGTPIPLGKSVFCDSCGEDYTTSPAKGGILFESKAICPTCAPAWEKGAKKYGEEQFIRGRCPEGKSFADWVRDFRGPNASVCITKL